MGESLPSRGTPARDPDHPTSSGASAGDRDTESDAERDDDRLVTEVEALAARADPVPEEVVEAARRVFKDKAVKRKKVAPRGSSGRDRK